MHLIHLLKRAPNRHLRFVYISGPLRRGVEYAVDRIRDDFGCDPNDNVTFAVDTSAFADILQELSLVVPQHRVVTLRNAEALTAKQWNTFFRWCVLPNATRVVVVTNEDNPRKGRFPSVFRWFAKYGYFIEARDFDEKTAIDFTVGYMNVSPLVAQRIVSKIGFSGDHLLSELQKLKFVGVTDPAEILDVVTVSPDVSFIRTLFGKRKIRIIMANEKFIMNLGLLELELVRQAAVFGGLRDALKIHEMCMRFNIPQFVIGDLIERVRATNPNQMANRLELVVRTQHLYRDIPQHIGLQDWFLVQWWAT